MPINERIEEALEVLWVCLVDANPQLNTESQLSEKLEIPLDRLVQKGLVESKNESVHFTPAGKQEAERAIRRHRLSERLFHDIIETDQADMEEAACQVEHIVKKGIEEKICRLLGHPETCPHGKPIPPGDCCRKARETKEKFVAPLASLKPGETGTIAYIKAGDSKKLQKLMAMGVLPGNAIELNANFPSFVFSVDYSQYAVDADMASAIVVKRGESGS
ncbi:iron/manganese-dependent transcriptional regulator [Desulfuromonas sp. DDH964]|uniref:metal-dependent transcriptional regulator n=1 Tax=Desulfuromonas sp. DDH964 TaxID=1823759 RepID=UPI00078C84FD|nr:metal-dependent transcriptional regulator [Desulfuromonas sp. DDH964]AMV70666.1 iron/manganese-dependent transcriptional regulator [Desulfuromonas sp. DDH964]